MQQVTTYICENCGREFNNILNCEDHEKTCNDKYIKYRHNVMNACKRAKEDFGDAIDFITFKVNDEIESYPSYGHELKLYKFGIEVLLSNGNHVFVYDGCDENLWLGNYLDEDTIYDSLQKHIKDGLLTDYTGIVKLKYEDGWEETYIGDIRLSDIMNRLSGRTIKISVTK